MWDPLCGYWDRREMQEQEDRIAKMESEAKTMKYPIKDFEQYNAALVKALVEELEIERRECDSESHFYRKMHMVNFLESALTRLGKQMREASIEEHNREFKNSIAQVDRNRLDKAQKDIGEIQARLDAAKIDYAEVLKMLKESTRG